MAGFEEGAKSLVATAAKIADLQGASVEASVLGEASAALVQTGTSEDWGNVTEFYTLMLEVSIKTYAQIEDQRERIEKLIKRRMEPLVRREVGKLITEVVVSPILEDASRPVDNSAKDGGIEEAPSFWEPGFFRLFISHTSSSKIPVHGLKQALADYQIAAFVAHDDIEPTKEWEAEIERALRTMDALAAVLSADFLGSRWCDQEVGFAFGRGKLVVPLCQDAVPHGFLGKYQGAKIKGLSAQDAAGQLFNILVSHDLTDQRMADALVGRMATSGTWDMAKRTMTLLEKLPHMNATQVASLVQTIETNDQVQSAFTVPGRIQSLVGRIGTMP